MKVKVSPSRIHGSVSAVPSKSHAHRLLIAAALADGESKVICPAVSRDIEATAECLNALGATVTRTEYGYLVHPVTAPPASALLDCGESGSTLRFLLPVACALGTTATFTGHGRLPSRPVKELAAALRKGGAEVGADSLPLVTCGKLAGSEFEVDASVSSQYVSGMLFALAATGKRCVLRTTGTPVSRGYTEMTLDALALFGKRVEEDDGVYILPAGRLHSPGELRAEGDWSSAAFMLAAGALAGDVTVTGLNADSAQRDKAIADILAKMGADVKSENDAFTVRAGRLVPVEADMEDTPDLAPVLSVVMAAAEGRSVMTGVGRLKDKESDRLAAIVSNLAAMGVAAETDGDTLTIYGGKIRPFAAHGRKDHRMVMSAAVAGLVAGGTVDDAEAVAKSYPSFFEDLRTLGGHADETV